MLHLISQSGPVSSFGRILGAAFLVAALCLTAMPLRAEDKTLEEILKDWPCDQRYNPELSLGAVWQGPSLDGVKKTWWEDEPVLEAVEELQDPTLTEDEIAEIINGFNAGLEGDKEKANLSVFAGVFEKSNTERRHMLEGIQRFVQRQRTLTDQISRVSEKMRVLRKEHGKKSADPEMMELDKEQVWLTRIYDERDRLTPYVCEEPLFLEQRLGIISRQIQEKVK